MSEHLLVKIQSLYPKMSKSQKSIATFITEHYDVAAYMTAAKLGQAVNVSESTVVRFATEIGFSGYPQMQRAIQSMIRSKLTSVQRVEVTAARVNDNSDIITDIMGRDIELIRATTEEASREEFSAAVDMLCSARRIYIVATRSASPLATFMGYYLTLVFGNVFVIDPSKESDVFEQMLHMNTQDVVIGISFPRYSRRFVTAMHFAAAKGVGVIAMTDSMTSPIVRYASRVLLAHSDMASIVDTLVAPMSLANALVVATALRRKDELCESLKEIESIWEEYDVYEKQGDVN